MDITVTEIMELADLHAHAKITDSTPAELLPRNLLQHRMQHRMQQICTDVFVLQCQLIEVRREVASLRERVQMLGQLARDVNSRRVLELEAQLEAVQEGRDIQGDIDRYNENTMTDTKQPEALRLADAMERFTKSSHWWTDGEPIHIAVAAELRSLHTENDTLRAGYDAARREIESLQAQAQQCGAGAGCCAQAARIEELEAQLEAVGAGGAGRLVPDVSLINQGDMPAAQALELVRVFWQQHRRPTR